MTTRQAKDYFRWPPEKDWPAEWNKKMNPQVYSMV